MLVQPGVRTAQPEPAEFDLVITLSVCLREREMVLRARIHVSSEKKESVLLEGGK